MSAKYKIAAAIYPHGLVNPTGVGMLTLNMTLTLARNPDIELKLLTSACELNNSGMLPEKHPLHGIPAIGLPWRREMREGCWLALNHPLIDRYLPADWWVYNSMETYVPARRCRRIVTVHHIETPPPASLVSITGLRQRLAACRLHKAVVTADLIVAQSAFTAREIMAQYRVPEARLAVVGSGVDNELFTAPVGAALHGAKDYAPYIISAGAFQPRKGTDYLFAMARELQRRGSPLKIICPFGLRGIPPFTNEVKMLPNVVALDYITREELVELIRGAVCMVIPSRLEGFGLTAIESMALGTPVIASNNSALPETLGGAGILVDPVDKSSLADAAEKILKDQEHRAKLAALGLRRAREFTWTKCMERLLDGIAGTRSESGPRGNSSNGTS
jgi:glycosyltransferase involved in cell wall biosynthesis